MRSARSSRARAAPSHPGGRSSSSSTTAAGSTKGSSAQPASGWRSAAPATSTGGLEGATASTSRMSWSRCRRGVGSGRLRPDGLGPSPELFDPALCRFDLFDAYLVEHFAALPETDSFLQVGSAAFELGDDPLELGPGLLEGLLRTHSLISSTRAPRSPWASSTSTLLP